MTVDNSKLAYFSGWDIDQLIASDIVVVTTGFNNIYTISANLVAIPTFELQYKPNGSAQWFKAGSQGFYSYINTGIIYAKVPSNGLVRYFVWADKVDY